MAAPEVTGTPVPVDGHWKRKPSIFRDVIPSPRFPAEKDRYVLYVNYCCPWAHRAIIVRALKGLEDIVQLVEADGKDPTQGWVFTGKRGPERDPIYGVKYLKELYLKADWTYSGRVTVPMLWDRKHETIVNNESSEIIRMFITAFDPLLPLDKREATKGHAALIPPHLRTKIDELNAFVYDTVNNGVYKAGFATSQSAYNEHTTKLFQTLDKLELHLGTDTEGPYLFGRFITEADIRLFTTLIRFDIVYYTLFKCNMKMIRLDYPNLHEWLRRLYWNDGPETGRGVFKETTYFDAIKRGYSATVIGNGIVPAGPLPHILPLSKS